MKRKIILVWICIIILFHFCISIFATEGTESIYYKDGKFYNDNEFASEMSYLTMEEVINAVESDTIIYMYSNYQLQANEIWENSNYTVTIQRTNDFTSGYIVSIPESFSLVMKEKIIVDGNKVQANSSGVLVNGELTINGGIIQNCYTSSQGGGLTISGTESVLNILSGAIQYNYAATHGGGIYANKAEINMSGGVICNNSTKVSENYTDSTGWGGGAYIYYSTFTMTDGHIDNNAGRIGGGLKIDGSTVTISGGTVNNNSAMGYDGSGGGIYLISGCTLALSNCEIVGNEAATNGGGIFPDSANEKVSISGKVIIKDNIGYYVDAVNGSPNDLYLPIRGGSLVKVEVTGSLEGSDIGIVDAGVAYSGLSPSIFATNYETYNDGILPATYFFSDIPNYRVPSSLDENVEVKLEKYYIVTFYNGTEIYYGKDVDEGEIVAEPEQPVKSGYEFLYWSTTENGSQYDFNNSITDNLNLYSVWEENEVIIQYLVSIPSDAPEDCATLSIDSENVRAFSGTVNGTKLSLKEGFKLVGWYDSNDVLISKDIDWIPEKNEEGVWENQIYTAKIDYAVVDITIDVNNSMEANQSYLFIFSGVEKNGTVFEPLKVVVISDENGHGSITIKDIPVGTYTVELDNNWTWRYKITDENIENTTNILIDESIDTYTFEFNNFDINSNLWLNGYDYYIYEKS